jgi:hypothetical protein
LDQGKENQTEANMGLFKKLADLFSPPQGGAGKRDEVGYWVAVRCNRCGETLRARVNLHNDLSIEYGEGDRETTYFCRKILIGDKLCFQRVEVELTFDAQRRLIDRKITGGSFLEGQEAQA